MLEFPCPLCSMNMKVNEIMDLAYTKKSTLESFFFLMCGCSSKLQYKQLRLSYLLKTNLLEGMY